MQPPSSRAVAGSPAQVTVSSPTCCLTPNREGKTAPGLTDTKYPGELVWGAEREQKPPRES